MMHYLDTFLIAFAGSFVQTFAGFGAPIVQLLVLPSFMPLITASGVSSVICMGGQVTSLAVNRKHFDLSQFWKNAAVPMACYLGVSVPTIFFVKKMDLNVLKLSFGIFLVLLAAYYAFFSKKVKMKPNLAAGIICGAVSGLFSGLFGIGGPLMALYYLSIAEDDKYFYIMLTQITFFAASLINAIVRVMNGIITLSSVPFILIGLAGMILGTRIAVRAIPYINAVTFKRFVYVVVAVSGIMNIAQCL